jgi:hypothetical protein
VSHADADLNQIGSLGSDEIEKNGILHVLTSPPKNWNVSRRPDASNIAGALNCLSVVVRKFETQTVQSLSR